LDCAKKRVFRAMQRSWKPGALAFAEKPTPTGICVSRGTFLWPAITPRVASKVKSISLVMMARRWHLWKSERVRSGRTCRHCPNSALPGKNNTWSFAPRSGFLRNVTSENVPAGLMSWPLITAQDSRPWYGCTKTLSALKCEGLTGTSSRRRQKRYNLESPVRAPRG